MIRICLRPRERRFERAGSARGGQRRPGACPCALLGLRRRRRDPRRQRPDLRRLQCRERRLPAEPVRRGHGDRGHGGGRRAARSPRSRWSAAGDALCSPAAAAASGWPSSGAPRRTSILAAPDGLRADDDAGGAAANGVRADQSRRRRFRRCADAAAVIRARAGGRLPLVGLVLGSGLGGIAERVIDPVVDRLCRPAGLSAPERAGPCRAARARPPSPASRSPACQGRAHLYEGVGPAPLNTLVRTLKAHRLPRAAADQRRGLAPAGMGRWDAGADRGPHQSPGHQPAARGQ